MNEHSFMDEDKLADIETRAIEGTAKRSGMDEEFVRQVVQDYTELIENLERYISERYPNGNINTHGVPPFLVPPRMRDFLLSPLVA